MSCFSWWSYDRLHGPGARGSMLALVGLVALAGCGDPAVVPQDVPAPAPPASVEVAVPPPVDAEAERQAALSRQIRELNGLQAGWERQQRQQRQQPQAPSVQQPVPAAGVPTPTVVQGWDAHAGGQAPYPAVPGVDPGNGNVGGAGSVTTTPAYPSAPGVQSGAAYPGAGTSYADPAAGTGSQPAYGGGFGVGSYGSTGYGTGGASASGYSSSGSSSSQCLGTTKKGARCRRITRSASGYCYQHGG